MKCKHKHLFYNCDNGMWGDATIQAARSATLNAEQATEDCKNVLPLVTRLASDVAELKERVAALEAKSK